ncbi:MAG TPA: glycosyltransferase family 25 protein [Candidatus Diapherotrites archaeon]|nr:glycosyltransferase family 25 protein [Candidatus Diapherotrites archaeon]
MNTLNKIFDRVICINLVNRPDKKTKMKERFDRLGIEVEWFKAVEYGFASQVINSLPPIRNDFIRFNPNNPNEFGAAISHYTVIKTAFLEGVEKIFVFEDDVLFRKDFNDKFDKYYNSLPSDWDMIMLYSFMYKIQPQNIRVNARWIKSYDSWSLMSYGMNRKAMERYISDQDNLFQIADRVSFKMQGKDLNIYSAIPTLCIPDKNMGSNIRGNNMNYVTNNTILNMGFSNDNYE